jgi:hypothetical protein
MMLPVGTNQRKNSSAGFTLIELALVALILAVIIGLSMPMLKKTYLSLASREASYSLIKMMSYGRESAIIKNKSYKILFGFHEARYELMELDTLQNIGTYKKADGIFGRAFKLPEGIEFSGPDKEVVFYPDGTVSPTKIVIGSKNDKYTIAVTRSGAAIERTGESQ